MQLIENVYVGTFKFKKYYDIYDYNFNCSFTFLNDSIHFLFRVSKLNIFLKFAICSHLRIVFRKTNE